MTQLVEIVEMLRSRPSVSASEMVDHIYGDDPEGGPLTALNVVYWHIWKLRQQGYEIETKRGWKDPSYRLVKAP